MLAEIKAARIRRPPSPMLYCAPRAWGPGPQNDCGPAAPEKHLMAKASRFQAPVARVVRETGDVLTFRFDVPAEAPFTYKPGQFVNLTVQTPEYGPEKDRLMRAYSISSSPTEGDFVDLTIKCYDDGHVTKHLRDVTTVGEVMTIEGPFSTFSFEEGQAGSVGLIGGGAGVGPMRGIVRYVLDRGLDVQMRYLASCRTPDDRIFLDSLIGWEARHPNLRVVHTVTRPEGASWEGPTGRIDAEKLRAHCPPDQVERYYIAGPTPMVREVRKLLKDRFQVDRKRILWEPWGG